MSAKALFSSDATVEYRVIPTLDGGVQWHWVLFNALDKVLGGGTSQTRGSAGVDARRRARQLRRKVRQVRVTGLMTEAHEPLDVRDFIKSIGSWMEVAEKSGYQRTDDKFWAKASQNEPIFARKIEGVDYTYSISVFGGTGTAKDGGLLIWVALDFEDNTNHNRIALHTFLTTEKTLPSLLGSLEAVIEAKGDSWGDVDRAVGNMRKAEFGIVEAAEDSGFPAERLPVNVAKDFIMGIESWSQRLNAMAQGYGPWLNRPEVCAWSMTWNFRGCFVRFIVRVTLQNGSEQTPCRVVFKATLMNGKGHMVDLAYSDEEQLEVKGDAGMNAFVDMLEPVVKTVEKWHSERKDEDQPTQMEFTRLVADLLLWMQNHPAMADYI